MRRRLADAGREPDAAILDAATAAGEQAAADVEPRLRALLEADVDEQKSTPLALIRSAAVRYPTAVLQQAGVAPVDRDRHQQDLFPDDLYDLAPASFADVDPALAELGMVWGAAKAFTHRQRHRGGQE